MSFHVPSSVFTPKLLVYKNGDISSVLNIKEIPFDKDAPLSKVLQDAQKAHNLPFKAKQLYTTSGQTIRSVSELKDSMLLVVGCGEPFRSRESSSAGHAGSGRSTPSSLSSSLLSSSEVFISPAPSPLPSSHPIPNMPAPFPTSFSSSSISSSLSASSLNYSASTPTVDAAITISPSLNLAASPLALNEQHPVKHEPASASSSSIPSTITPTPTAISPSPSASPILSTRGTSELAPSIANSSEAPPSLLSHPSSDSASSGPQLPATSTTSTTPTSPLEREGDNITDSARTPRDTTIPSSIASTPRAATSATSAANTPREVASVASVIPSPRGIPSSSALSSTVSTPREASGSSSAVSTPREASVSSTVTTPREASVPSSTVSTPREASVSSSTVSTPREVPSAESILREIASTPSSAASTPREPAPHTTTSFISPISTSIPLSSATTPRQAGTSATSSPRAPSSGSPRSGSSSHKALWVLGEGEGRGGATKDRIGRARNSETTHVYAVHTSTHTLFHSSASSSPIYWIWGEGEGKGGGTKHRIGTVRLDESEPPNGSEDDEEELGGSESEDEEGLNAGWTLGEGEGRGGATRQRIGDRKRSSTTSPPWVLGEGEGRGKGTKDKIGSRSPTISASSPLSPSISARVAPHWYRQEWKSGEGEGRGGATREKIGGERKGHQRPWVVGEGEGKGGATQDRIGRTRSNSASAASSMIPLSRVTLTGLKGWVLGEGEGRGGATKERIGSRSPQVSRKSWVWGEGEGRGGGTKDRIGSRGPLSPPSSSYQGWILGEGEGRGKATKERIGVRATTRIYRSNSNPSTPHIDSFNGWVWGFGEGRGKGTKEKIGEERELSPKISPRKRSSTGSSTSSSHDNGSFAVASRQSWVLGEGEGHGGGTKERIGDRFSFHHTWVWGQGEGKGGATKEKIGERIEASGRYLYRQFSTHGRDEEGEDEFPSPGSSPNSSGRSSPTSTHGYLSIPPLSLLSSPVLHAQTKPVRSSSTPPPLESQARDTPSPHSSKSSRASPSPTLSRKSRSVTSSVASSPAPSPSPSPLPSSRSQSPPAYTARSVSSVSSTSSASTWGVPTSRSVSSRTSAKPRSYSTGTPVASKTPPPASTSSARVTPGSPSQQRTRGGAPKPPQPETGKEDWLWRGLEGFAVAGVQGVSEDNDRFGPEVKQEARETVSRMRVSVGPSTDSVSFQCSLAVVGPPKSGKTSLLYALAKALSYELAAAEQWKSTFIFPVCWSSLLATSYDLLSLYNKVVARVLYMLPLAQAIPNLSTKLATFFATLLSQAHLPRIPNEFSELKPDQVWSLKHLAENIQKTWHNGTADAFALAIARLPVAISELFDYSQVLFVYDDMDAAQVLLGKGTHPQGASASSGKMEKRFLTHLKSVLVGRICLFCFSATKSLLRSLAEEPVDIASSLEVVSTLDIIPTSVFLEKYPECNVDLIIEGSGRQVTLTPSFFGGAPGYLAKVVDLIHAHQTRVMHDQGEESEGILAEREHVEELKVFQLVKALSGAPMWAKSAETQAFPIDAPLSARFVERHHMSSISAVGANPDSINPDSNINTDSGISATDSADTPLSSF